MRGEAAHDSPLPDAALIFADRMIAFDHAEAAHLPALPRRDRREPRTPSAGSPTRPPGFGSLPARSTSLPGFARRSGRVSAGSPARALPGGDRRVQAAARRGRDLRGLPDQRGRRRRRPRAARRSTAPCAGSTRRRSPPSSASARRAVLSSSPERFLRDRSRPLGRGEADQGDEPARRDARRRTCASRRLRRRREEPGGEPDDRRPAAQRPRRRLRGRHRRTCPT